MTKRRWQISITQAFLLMTLCALTFGTVRISYYRSLNGRPIAVALSADARQLAAMFDTGRIVVWDIADGKVQQRQTLAQPSASWPYSTTPHLSLDGTDTLLFDTVDAAGNVEVVVWDLKKGRAIRSTPCYLVEKAADASTIAMVNEVGEVDIVNVASAEKIAKLPVSTYEAPAFSPDGTHAAIADESTTAFFVYDIENDRTIAAIDTGYTIDSLALTRDIKKVVVAGSARGVGVIQIWDLETRTRDCEIEVRARFEPRVVALPTAGDVLLTEPGFGATVFDVEASDEIARLGDDRGSDASLSWQANVVATSDSLGIALWDATTYEKKRVIWEDLRASTLLYITFAFVAWAVVWGLLVRTRDDAMRFPVSTPTPSLENVESTQHNEHAPLTQRAFKIRNAAVIVGLASVVVVVATLAAMLGVRWGEATDLLWVLAAPILLAVLFPAIIYYWRSKSGFLYSRVPRARSIAQTDGFLSMNNDYRAWFAGPSSLAERLTDDVNEGRRRFAAIFGNGEVPSACFTLLAFNTPYEMARFIGSVVPYAAAHLRLTRENVICEPNCIKRLSEPRRVSNALLGFHFLSTSGRFGMPPWLLFVVKQAIEMRDDERILIQHTHRHLQAMHVRGELNDLESWLTIKTKQLGAMQMKVDEPGGLARLQPFYSLTASLAWFLLGDDAPATRRDAFQEYVRAWRRGQSTEVTFREHFGYDFTQLLQHWRAWLMEQPTDEFIAASPLVHETLENVVLPRIANESLELAERRNSLDAVAGTGLREAVPALLRLSRTESSEFKADVVAALESISGKRFNDDEDDWAAWWEQADAEVSREIHRPVLATASESEIGPSPSTSENVAPPSAVPSAVHLMMGMGGIVAIILAVVTNFAAWWLPTAYLGGFVGISAIIHAVSRRQTKSKRIAILQCVNILSCDVPNLLLGLVELAMLRHRKTSRSLSSTTQQS